MKKTAIQGPHGTQQSPKDENNNTKKNKYYKNNAKHQSLGTIMLSIQIAPAAVKEKSRRINSICSIIVA